MKHVLRQIVGSSTYRQDSRLTAPLHQRDPANRLLARGPPVRLPAELIRDQALACSGLLTRQMGGPPVYPPQPAGLWKQTGRNEPIYATQTDDQRFRRGVYVIWRRAAPYPSFVNFDAPDRMACVVERPKSNTPLQALTLLNDDAYVEMAQALAARIIRQALDKRPDAEIDHAFRICLSRRPTDRERQIMRRCYEDEWSRLQQSPDDIARLLQGAEALRLADPPTDPHHWAVWCCLANLLLNLDETMTKG